MLFALGILVFVVAIAASIALHELGHMLPAKLFGVRVSQFMVGFGKTLWSRPRGETEYGVKAIPLGGYVRLVGMIPPASEVKEVRGGGWAAQLIRDTREVDNEHVEEGEEHRAFYRLAWWKKVIVMAGGPVMNLVIAVVLFSVMGLAIGLPATAPVVDSVVPCAMTTIGDKCEAGDPPSAAAAGGLQPGDRVVSVDGMAITSWSELSAAARDGLGKTLEFDVKRDGTLVTLQITPTARDYYTFDDAGNAIVDDNGDPVLAPAGFLGMSPGYDRIRQPWYFGFDAVGQTIKGAGLAILHLPGGVVNAGKAIVGKEDRSQDGLVSIVGAASSAGEVASADLGALTTTLYLLNLIAAVNVALFAFNMIPLLPLDGGHIASALWQAVKNGWARVRGQVRPAPVDVARLMPLAYGVFAVLILVGAVLIVADIVAPVSLL